MAKREYNGKVRVDAKIEAMIRPLTEDEANTLEESLLIEGKAVSPLWLWGDLLVDGHNRFRLCKKHKLPYEVKQVYEDAEDIEDVMDRIRRDSLARRNLTSGEQSKYRAERVAYEVKQGATPAEAIRTVAKESNVSVRQVQRDVKRAELVEALDEDLKPVAVEMSTPVVKKLASMSKPKQKAIAKRADGDGKAIEKAIKAKGKEKTSAAKLFSTIQMKHFSGRGGIPQMLDAMAEANGGQGNQYKAANAGLDGFLKAAAQMRDGKL